MSNISEESNIPWWIELLLSVIMIGFIGWFIVGILRYVFGWSI